MAAEDGNKTCRYQIKDGEVINQLFPMGNKDWKISKGWYESPKAAKAAGAKSLETKLGKSDDNSSRFNKQLSEAGGDTGRGSDAGRGNQLGCFEPSEQDDSSVAQLRG